MNIGEVWYANFPYEDKPGSAKRPVVILDIDTLLVLSVKVTKHKPRENDKYDTPILYWKQAHLRMASTARVSKVISIPKSDFIHKIGDLHPDDFNEIKTQYVAFISTTE